MGTDIHAVFQAKKNGKWVDVHSNYDERRHYALFGLLANVRNGYGFAGIKYGDPLEPISDPRGLPRDFKIDDDRCHKTTRNALANWRKEMEAAYGDEESRKRVTNIWMGDHSYSWLTADEILSASLPVVKKVGVIDIEEYGNWDGESEPCGYCGDVSGRSVRVVDMEDANKKNATHVRVRWLKSMYEEFDYFFKEIKRLKDEYGDIRMVFGFDS